VDPIADQFAWVSVYNYAENEPIRHIDLHGLQKALPTGPGAGRNYVLEGFRRMFQASGNAVDKASVKVSVARRAPIKSKSVSSSKTKGKGVNVKAEAYAESKVESKTSTNIASFLDPGNWAKGSGGDEYQGPPLVQTDIKETTKEVNKLSVSGKVRGLDVKVTGEMSVDMKSGESSSSTKGQVGSGNNAAYVKKSGEKINTGIQLQNTTEHRDNTKTVITISLDYQFKE
jgi:hypothetical protein